MTKTETDPGKELAANMVLAFDSAYNAGCEGKPRDYRLFYLDYIEANPHLSPYALGFLDRMTEILIVEYEKGVRHG